MHQPLVVVVKMRRSAATGRLEAVPRSAGPPSSAQLCTLVQLAKTQVLSKDGRQVQSPVRTRVLHLAPNELMMVMMKKKYLVRSAFASFRGRKPAFFIPRSATGWVLSWRRSSIIREVRGRFPPPRFY